MRVLSLLLSLAAVYNVNAQDECGYAFDQVSLIYSIFFGGPYPVFVGMDKCNLLCSANNVTGDLECSGYEYTCESNREFYIVFYDNDKCSGSSEMETVNLTYPLANCEKSCDTTTTDIDWFCGDDNEVVLNVALQTVDDTCVELDDIGSLSLTANSEDGLSFWVYASDDCSGEPGNGTSWEEGCDEFYSAWFGINLDVGIYFSAGSDASALMQSFAFIMALSLFSLFVQ